MYHINDNFKDIYKMKYAFHFQHTGLGSGRHMPISVFSNTILYRIHLIDTQSEDFMPLACQSAAISRKVIYMFTILCGKIVNNFEHYIALIWKILIPDQRKVRGKKIFSIFLQNIFNDSLNFRNIFCDKMAHYFTLKGN